MTRALDALVATHALGWTQPVQVRRNSKEPFTLAFRERPLAPGETYMGVGEYTRHFAEDGTKYYCGKPCALWFPRPWSSDISAAFAVVEAMRAKGWMCDIDCSGSPKLAAPWLPAAERAWSVMWWCEEYDGDGQWLNAASDSLPEAICLAALRALGVESSVIEKARSA